MKAGAGIFGGLVFSDGGTATAVLKGEGGRRGGGGRGGGGGGVWSFRLDLLYYLNGCKQVRQVLGGDDVWIGCFIWRF